MREYKVIDAASSIEQLRLRLKDTELEQYGDAFIPEFVYDVIKRLPRFASMKVCIPTRLSLLFGPQLMGCSVVINKTPRNSLASC